MFCCYKQFYALYRKKRAIYVVKLNVGFVLINTQFFLSTEFDTNVLIPSKKS